VFSIGDGADTQNRHNLMELKTDGTLLLNGNAVKTEGGDDDNKLRLGQIEELTGGNNISVDWKKGFGKRISSTATSVVFTSNAPSLPPLLNTEFHFFGDFVGYNSAEGIKIFPITGRKTGKPTTGKWIYVEDCYSMFVGCTAIASLDLSMFDTSRVGRMINMFNGCTALTSLDLSAFDTSSVVSMQEMFIGCTHLVTLDISSFDMTNVVKYGNMFGNSSSNRPPLTTLKTPKINPHDDIPLNQTLYSQDGTAYTNLPVTTGTSIELRQSWT
jgi:surface protein